MSKVASVNVSWPFEGLFQRLQQYIDALSSLLFTSVPEFYRDAIEKNRRFITKLENT